jgi:hypothetical protein
MHKRSDVSSFLKNFGVGIIVYKLEQLIKYLLDVVDFFEVTGHQRHFGDQLLLF